VEFEWNERKAASNLRKHGISFPVATRVFLDPKRIEQVDDREAYGEDRFVTVGLVDGIELFVAYTLRTDSIRIISARKADRHESNEYWNG
jgi:uncharacterized protein